MSVKTSRFDQARITRQTLVETARRLFGEQGYVDTPLDQILDASGLTKGALYHHFSSKEDLFRAVFEAVKQELSQAVGEAQMPPDPWGSLLAGARTWIEVHTDPAVVRIVLFDARAVLAPEVWHDVDRRWGTVIIRAGLRRAMNHGVIGPAPLGPLSTIIRGAYTEACLLVAESDDPKSAREDAIAIIEMLLTGLRAG